MKNLHKKISSVLLASMVLFGGVGVNRINSFAASNNIVGERSFIGINYRGFVGNQKDFKDKYNNLIRKVSHEEYEKYEKMIDKIENIVKKLPSKRYFRLYYAGLPFNDDEIKKLKKEYNLEDFPGSSVSVNSIIYSIYRYGWFQRKNYIVSFKDSGKDYKFIFYGEDR